MRRWVMSGLVVAAVTAAVAVAMRERPPSVAACPLPAGDARHPGMVWIAAGDFTMGSDNTFPEEGPAVHANAAGFWIDQTEVTNAQFAQFVSATGYRTLAERGVRIADSADAPTLVGSAVFRPREAGGAMMGGVNWWQFMAGADWRHPDGPESSLRGREHHPVVHVAFEDAQAYARWKGRSLPTETQFEYAAQGAARRSAGEWAANTWQGTFPSLDTVADGYSGTAPVGCFGPNPNGLYDMVGNVWEWTQTPYRPRHDAAVGVSAPGEDALAVIKGGSYLCSPDYCMRYRPEARVGQSQGLGAAHIGFRTVLDPEKLP